MTSFFGKLTNRDVVESVHPDFKAAFDFLERDDIFSLPEGRYEISGDDRCYAVIETPLLRLPDQAQCEAHKRFIDIHFPLSGPEYIGIGTTPDEIVQNGFVSGKDIVFFDVDVEYRKIEIGEFAVIMPPYCAHKPAVTMDTVCPLKKVIIKIACDNEHQK